MGKKRWHKRLSVTVLAAILAVNYGGANISARAETVSAVEESIQAEAKGLTASPSDAEKTEKPENTKLPEISAAVKETGSAMYADAAEDTVYTISHASDGFSVKGGALTDTKVTTLTEAVKQILDQSETKKVAIHFDNIVSSENDGIQLDTPCELTLTGSYEAVGSSGALFKINSAGRFTIHNTANITISYQAIINRKENDAEVIFEHNGGTLTHSAGETIFNLKPNDKVYLTGGEINGTAFGNEKGGYVGISGGVWNGSISSVKEVNISGGSLKNCEAGEYSIYAIRGAEKISISGGQIYAENTNTASATRAAYAISMANKTELTLSGDVDISALCNGGKQGSLYYSKDGSYPTVDATGLTSINSGFTLAPYSAAMDSSSALTNWMECSDDNIDSLLASIKLNVICPNATTQAKYDSYILKKAAGNYIRIVDKNASASQIVKGVIKKADIQQSTVEGKYDVTVTYAPGGEGTEENKNYQYDKTSGSVSGILNDILLMNTGAAGPQITIGSTANPISENITIDTAGFIEENAVVLEGKIEGRVTVTGKGTLKSSLSCYGFVGATPSTIHITGGEIIGVITKSPIIQLSAANLIVEGDSTLIRNANLSGSAEICDTISATGGVQVTIRGGTIESYSGRALYIYRKGDSVLADSYASLLVEGGTIIGAQYGIYNTEHNEVTIKGGTIHGDIYDIFLAHNITQSSREPKKFTVENESSSNSFPFDTMQIENLSSTNEIDFTKAKFKTNDNNLSIVLNSGALAGKLFRVSTKEYRSFLEKVKLSGPEAPVCVVYNSAEPSASQNTTDIYAFPKTEQRTVHVKYYNEYKDTEPFYDEYLLKGYTVNGAESISSYLSKTVPSGINQAEFSVWRYKDKIRKGTAADETKAVNQLVEDTLTPEATGAPVVELYAGYKVSLTGNAAATGDSSVSFEAKSDGTTLYYTEDTKYSPCSGEELRAAAKAEATKEDFRSFTSGDGKFTISYTGREPGQSYSCIMVAENENLDVSDALKLTATTNNRVLKKDDFSIGETKFTYTGNQDTHGVSVTPTSKNSGKFEIDMVRYKKKEGEEYTGDFLGAQAAAGVYGVFVTTKSEATGINRATNLLLCDMTIEKADFDPSWFKTFSKITYGEDAEGALKPVIREEYSTAGGTAIITGYGEISYKLYEDKALTKEVSRNSEGHYDVCLKEDGTVGQYYVGVTCTEGSAVKAQKTPAAIFNNQLTIEKADYTFSGLTCENIDYGESPAPEVQLQNADVGPVRFAYTQNTSGSDSAAWSVGNNAGTWYVCAEIDESRNFKAVKSEWKAFTVNKAKLTVTAKNLRIPVKSEIPKYEAVYKGFAGGDNAASLGGNLKFTCSYTKESEVGTYKIMPYGLTSENYELCFVEGTLTVEEKSGGGSSSGGGSNSGGGGSSSGGSSSKNDSTIIDRPDKDNPTTPTTAETKTVKADKKGNVGITKSMVSDAISTAQADARKNGNTANGIEVVVPVKISKTLNGVQITLKADALDKLVSSGVKRITIDADRMADFGFTLDTLKKINQQTSGDIVLKVKKITVTSVKAKAAIKKRPVYDISLWEVKNVKKTRRTNLKENWTSTERKAKKVKKTKLINLRGKTISIAIPYTPKKNEQPGNLYAVSVNGKGKPQWITRSGYDADQKAVIFELTKSGVYGVGYKAKKPVLTDINNH